MNKVIAIIGPTASGKTAASIKLAKELDTHVIAMDSMQIYRHMDIGTAKPSALDMEGIPHHMLDVVEPDESYSVAEYKRAATECIKSIQKMGKIPILVGGTGLYLKALCTDMHLGNTLGDESTRSKYEQFAKTNGNDALYAKLMEADEKSALRLHPNDVRRIVRALEIFELTGRRLSDRETSAPQSAFDMTIFGIATERSSLIERINQRVDMMIAQHLPQEVESLLTMGISPEAQAMQGIGYKELIPCIRGQMALESAVETIKIRTRQYAKRQMTWFRATSDVHWITPNKINQSLLEV